MAAAAWTVVVPFKQAGERKTRLSTTLNPAARNDLAERMARHVLAAVTASPSVHVLLLLARHRPEWWGGAWREDDGRGLNPIIAASRAVLAPAPFAIVHADLPLLTTADVTALLGVGERDGLAIASDRHGTGTNAVAIADARTFRFAFGADSLARHRAQGGTTLHIPGLAFDIDTSDDLAEAGNLDWLETRRG